MKFTVQPDGRRQLEPGIVKGSWWHAAGAGRFQCDLCPRECKLKPGQRGFCFVREAREDGIYLNTYGRASGFCVDPIEKKPLNHFYPGTSVLSFGTAGCNLGCRFCQNWSISKAKANDRLTDQASPRQLAKAALRANCTSVAFTYNDPIVFAEYAIDCARAARDAGIKTVAVTAGYIQPEAREDFFSLMDAVNVDLKAFSENFYRKICYAHLDPILETLIWLKEKTNVWIEVTTLLIPGKNDSDQELRDLTHWFSDHLGSEIPLHFSAFHPDFKMRDLPRTPSETLSRARNIAMEAGLKYVYTGNVHDSGGQSTYCAQCGMLLIERNWYELGRWHLNEQSCCTQCGHPLAGHFDNKPGNWGAKRARIRIGID